jgi:hypothetical protein
MEVGAPASGIEVALGANALTPRHEDLEAGIWARGSFPPAAPVVYLVWAGTAALKHLRSKARTSTLLNKQFSLSIPEGSVILCVIQVTAVQRSQSGRLLWFVSGSRSEPSTK